MKLTCADPACDRAPMRERDGQRWCMYHPDAPAPDMDMVSGKLRGPDGKPVPGSTALEPPRHRRRQPPKPARVPAPRRRPARPATAPAAERPTPLDLERAYNDAADQVLAVEAQQPAAPTRRRASRSPAGPALDHAAVARRYAAGERLFDLAASLHIGVQRLRRILDEQRVPVRGRGTVLGVRGRPARPFDPDEAERLYREGMDSHQVARSLGVQQARVREVLRARGVLKAQPGSTRPLDVEQARQLYATGLTVGQVAFRLGVRHSRVADVLRDAGELRPRGPGRRAG